MINVTIKKINIKRTFIEFNTQSLQTAMILKQNLKQMEKVILLLYTVIVICSYTVYSYNEINSTHSEGKFVVAKRFTRTLKNKITNI